MIPCGHSYVPVPKQLLNRVNVRPLHPKPGRGGVPKVMEAEILDIRGLRRATEGH